MSSLINNRSRVTNVNGMDTKNYRNRCRTSGQSVQGYGNRHKHQSIIIVCLVISVVNCQFSPVDSFPMTSQSQSLQNQRKLDERYRQRSHSQPDWDYLDENPLDASEAISSSLSIVSPLEVLRQTLAAEMKKNRIRQIKDRRVASNNEYIRRIGRRR